MSVFYLSIYTYVHISFKREKDYLCYSGLFFGAGAGFGESRFQGVWSSDRSQYSMAKVFQQQTGLKVLFMI